MVTIMTVPFLLAKVFAEEYLALDENGYFVFPLVGEQKKRRVFAPYDRFNMPAFTKDLHALQVKLTCLSSPSDSLGSCIGEIVSLG